MERRVSGGEVLVGNGVRVAGMVRSGREDDVLSRTDDGKAMKAKNLPIDQTEIAVGPRRKFEIRTLLF